MKEAQENLRFSASKMMKLNQSLQAIENENQQLKLNLNEAYKANQKT